MRLNNPFLISGYEGPDYFCDRENETVKVIEALSNDRNISLISPRRMGKTGLIQHVFYKLEEENVTYKTYCELIPKGQLRLLRAIAREKKVYEPYESVFMKKYDLTAVSSVKQSLEALKEKSFILKNEDGSYFVYDRFFSIWLEK